MKRLLSIIISGLLLLSCQKEDATVPTTVFIAKDKTPISCEITPLRVFSASHGGNVIEHTYIGNDYIIQEEIITNMNSAIQYWCNIFDITGTHIISVAPAADIGYDLNRDNIALGEVFHLVDSLYIEKENESIFILLTPEGICAYTEEGALKWCNNALTADDIFTYENSVFILNGNAGKQKITKINLNDGEILKDYNFDGEYIGFEALGDNDIIFTGNDTHIYAANELGLYQLIIQENNKSIDIQLITDWSSSNILPGIIKSINVIDEQTIEIIQSDITSDEINKIKYVRATDDELSEANDIILAVFTTRNDYQLPVYYFNQDPQNDKIHIRNYSAYEQEQQILRFNADMAAGDSPDMVIMWQNDTLNSTISMYERADIFSDLISLFRESRIINYDDLLAYVTEPYKFEEKQYIFPLNPSVECYFGDTVYFDGPVTIDEYLDICLDNDLGCLNAKRLFSATVDDYYNETTAECSFDNGILAQQMTRATLLQQNSNAQPLNRITLSYTTLFNYAETMLSFEGEWIPVGYPNEKKELCMGNSLAEYYAILESSTHKDVAVHFLHKLIQDNTISLDSTDAEEALLSICYGYTFYKSDIYKQVELFKDKTIVINGTALSVYEDHDPDLSKADGFHLKLTQAHADSMYAFLNSITRRVNNANPVQKIFWEEYWAMDDRPIETMLDYVQSKVSLYLSEQMD